MKKLLFFATLLTAFLLPSSINACQGTIYAQNGGEAKEMKAQAKQNCNPGDSFILVNLSTGKSELVTAYEK